MSTAVSELPLPALLEQLANSSPAHEPRLLCSPVCDAMLLLALQFPSDCQAMLLPEFDGVWWREARRYYRSEVDREGFRSRLLKHRGQWQSSAWYDLSRALRIELPARQRRRSEEDWPDGYCLFVLPAKGLSQAVSFLDAWHRALGARCYSTTAERLIAEQRMKASGDRLFFSYPHSWQSIAVPDPVSLTNDLRALNVEVAAGLLRASKVSGGMISLSGVPDHEPDWEPVFAARAELVGRALSAEHYALVQALLARDQYANDFVHEAVPERAYGKRVVHWPGAIQQLLQVGLALERNFPVLGQLAWAA